MKQALLLPFRAHFPACPCPGPSARRLQREPGSWEKPRRRRCCWRLALASRCLCLPNCSAQDRLPILQAGPAACQRRLQTAPSSQDPHCLLSRPLPPPLRRDRPAGRPRHPPPRPLCSNSCPQTVALLPPDRRRLAPRAPAPPSASQQADRCSSTRPYPGYPPNAY